MKPQISKVNRNGLAGVAVSPKSTSQGWQTRAIGDDGRHDLLHSPSLDRFLSEGGLLEFEWDGTDYEAPYPEMLASHLDNLRSQGKKVFDAPKVRMSSDPAEGEKVTVSRTSYFQGLLTNELCLKELTASGGIGLDGTAAAFPDGVIPPLSDSALSNHIGCSVLAFDDAGKLLLCVTTSNSAVAGGKISPSGSGSCEVADFEAGGDVTEAVIRSMERELREEAGLADDTTIETRMIAFHRHLERGGKPEFVGVSRVHGKWSDLRRLHSKEEAAYTERLVEVDVRNLGLEGLHSWLATRSEQCSPSLKAAAMAFFDEMSRDGSLLPVWLTADASPEQDSVRPAEAAFA